MGNKVVLEKKIRSNALWGIFGNLSSSAANFLVFIVIARFLGASEFGSFAYVFAIATLFSMMGQAGLDGLLSRELIEKKEAELEILGTAGFIRLIGYIFGMVLTLLYAYLIPSHSLLEQQMFVVAAIFVFMNVIAVLPENWLKSMDQAQVAAKARIWSNLIGSILKIIVVIVGGGALILSFIHLLSLIITSIFMYYCFLNCGGPKINIWSFSYRRARELLGESWHLFLSAILWVAYMRIDLAIMRYMSSPEMVANYAITTRIAEVTYAIPSAIIIAFFPSMLIAKGKSNLDYNSTLQDILYVLTFLGVTVSIFSIFFAYFGIVPFFGEEYSTAVNITIIYMISTPLFFIHYLVARWILMERLTKFGVINDLVGVFIKGILTFVLINFVGIEGAAIATIISYTILAWLSLILFEKGRYLAYMILLALVKPWKGFFILYSKFLKS